MNCRATGIGTETTFPVRSHNSDTGGEFNGPVATRVFAWPLAQSVHDPWGLVAVAVQTCRTAVLARPMYRFRRRPNACTPCEGVPLIPARTRWRRVQRFVLRFKQSSLEG